jgi:midasin (ATPase involved in ribosome maturation)
VRVFAHIVKEGFCRPADEHEGEGEGQSKSLEDDVEGTGMGAGEGVSQRCTAVLFSES